MVYMLFILHNGTGLKYVAVGSLCPGLISFIAVCVRGFIVAVFMMDNWTFRYVLTFART